MVLFCLFVCLFVLFLFLFCFVLLCFHSHLQFDTSCLIFCFFPVFSNHNDNKRYIYSAYRYVYELLKGITPEYPTHPTVLGLGLGLG